LKTTKSQRNSNLFGGRRIRIPRLRTDETEVFEELGNASQELPLIVVGVQRTRTQRL